MRNIKGKKQSGFSDTCEPWRSTQPALVEMDVAGLIVDILHSICLFPSQTFSLVFCFKPRFRFFLFFFRENSEVLGVSHQLQQLWGKLEER